MLEVQVDERQMRALQAALADEGTGRAFRRDLAHRIEDALAPAVPRVKGELFGMPTRGAPHPGEPLRTAIARQITVQARLGGKASGAFIRVSRQRMPRGFRHAPKRLNQASGWRHGIFGRGMVVQVGEPGWFDNPLQARRAAYRAAVIKAMDGIARRVTRRV